MGNQVRPRRGSDRSKRASDRRKTQPRRRKVEMIALHHEAHCGPSGKKRGGLRSLFRIGLVALLLLAPLLVAAGTLAEVVDPAPDSPYWDRNAPQALGNPQRSGTSTFTILDQDPQLRWSVEGFAPFLAGPVMDEANVYVADRNGVVAAINLTTGEDAWRVELKQEVRATPALAYGWLYVVTEAKQLHALSVHSGNTLFTAKLDEASRAPPLVLEGRVYVGTEKGTLQVFDATTLDLIWGFDLRTTQVTNGTATKTTDAATPLRAAPAAYDGLVHIAGWNKRVHALTTHGDVKGNPANLAWTKTVTDRVVAPVVVDRHTDTLLVATGDGRIEAFNRETGQARWGLHVGDAFTGAVAVNQTLLVAGTTDGHLIGLHPTNGHLLWKTYEPSGFIASPLMTEDALVTLAANGTLALRDPTNGSVLVGPDGRQRLWRLDESSHATPAVTRKGIVVVDQGGHVALVGPRPDLVTDLTGALTTAGNITAAAPVALVGKATNHGRDVAPDVQATLYLDGKPVDAQSLGRLAAGESTWWNLTLGMGVGDHTVEMVFAPTSSRDPTPDDATATLQVKVRGADVGGSNGQAGNEVDINDLYGRDITGDWDGAPSDERGFLDGVRGAWTGWMVPVAFMALVGGVFLGRYVKERGTRDGDADV